MLSSGQRIAFLGASVAAANPGFTRLFEALATAVAPALDLRYTFAGVGGNRVPDLVSRVGHDVLASRPDWVVIQTPTNDLRGGTDLGDYTASYRELLDLVTASGASVVVMPPLILNEDLASSENRLLRDYRERVRQVATEAGAMTADVDLAFERFLPLAGSARGVAPDRGTRLLTVDGVHPNAAGNALLAMELLFTFGLWDRRYGGDWLGSARRVCFLGDSITAADPGYTRGFAALETALHPERALEYVYAGIGGNRVGDLLGRLDRDVLAHHPDWVTVSIGVNDVWHRPSGGGTPAPAFREGYRELLERITSAGCRPVVLTPTLIGEDPDGAQNQELEELVEIERELAARADVPVCDMAAAFVGAVRARQAAIPRERWPVENGATRFWTTDGVHMNLAGNMLMACTMLRPLAT